MAAVPEKVRQCESIIGYEFAEKRHGIEALFAYSGSCRYMGSTFAVKKNDALGIFGDIAASNSNLASIGKARGLDACVVLNPGTAEVTDSVMATTVEAIIGAVSLDGGRAAAEKVMDRLNVTHELLTPVKSKTLLPSRP
ncbi:RNase3 domain protein [Cladophialophora carrionii]|uniref:RNase3 domain protein n=1 Tax=Cladophialophora carrionii TaxID=86049 RepID=A0A1C1CTZ7_9EURO|nr:RNase3 domain protein [Cladophialophora carrionii]